QATSLRPPWATIRLWDRHRSHRTKARDARAHLVMRCALASTERQPEHEGLPALLECGHVALAENALERFVSRGIGHVARAHFAIKADQQPAFLEVITEVACLGVVRPRIVVVERTRRRRGERFETR